MAAQFTPNTNCHKNSSPHRPRITPTFPLQGPLFCVWLGAWVCALPLHGGIQPLSPSGGAINNKASASVGTTPFHPPPKGQKRPPFNLLPLGFKKNPPGRPNIFPSPPVPYFCPQ